MKKTILLGIAVPLFIVIFFVFFKKTENSSFKKIKIGENMIFVEIADTPEKRKKGLSGRNFLPENQGMIFLFEKPDYHSFWMKEMKFPLDFIWIFEDRVVEITENVNPFDYQPPNILTPKEKVDKVLEANAGFVKKFNIKVGDKINFQN